MRVLRFLSKIYLYEKVKSVHTKSFKRLLLRFYVSDVSFKVSCPNLKFSDVLEFLRIPLGLNSALLEDAEAGWRSVWQLVDSISMTFIVIIIIVYYYYYCCCCCLLLLFIIIHDLE